MIDLIASEQQVETMIAEGRRIIDEAIAEHEPVQIVAMFSGGDDSVVSSHFAVSQYGAVVLNCNTETGVRPTQEHIEATASRLGWHLLVERAPVVGPPKEFKDGTPFDPGILPCGEWTDGATAYEESVLNWGCPGPSMHGRIYQRLKERPIRAALKPMRTKRGQRILLVSGIRGDESSVRAGYKRHAHRVESMVWVNPFYWRTAADFEVYRQEFGLPRNPAKRIVGISGECCCGAFAHDDKTAEMETIRRVDAARAEYLTSLASKATEVNGFPWNWGEEAPKWWADQNRGQAFLFPIADEQSFRPMCVGCVRRQNPTLIRSAS